MYDKVKLWVDRYSIGEKLPDIGRYLESPKEQRDITTGEVKIFGYLEGLRLGLYQSGLSIEGSLPKFLFNNNIITLNRESTQQAIVKIKDILHIDIDEAKVLSLEFAANFNMRYPVYKYLEMLGDMPGYNRANFTPTSLYYSPKGKSKVFNFYDKTAEAMGKQIIPNSLNSKNLLRYEMRLNRRLPKQFKVDEVTALKLSDPQFYKLVVDMYQEKYLSISKKNKLIPIYMDKIKTPKDACEVLFALLIDEVGEVFVYDFIRGIKQAKLFDDPKNHSRFKQMIKKITSNDKFTIADDLIKELDDKIKNIGAYNT